MRLTLGLLIMIGLLAFVLLLGLFTGWAVDRASGGICPECSETPTTIDPAVTAEVTPDFVPVFPQRHDFDADCRVTILDLTLQAGDFTKSYPNYDGWVGEFDEERARLEDHDVDLDTRISILDLTLTARAFGLSWDPPCAPVVD